mmetsp:Transcript_10867/g.24288  ORF Transcript_10867/g.24288 Transcript_10867/m.24288 type:complete len:216 (+) Transcript_10867:160-807(+)
MGLVPPAEGIGLAVACRHGGIWSRIQLIHSSCGVQVTIRHSLGPTIPAGGPLFVPRHKIDSYRFLLQNRCQERSFQQTAACVGTPELVAVVDGADAAGGGYDVVGPGFHVAGNVGVQPALRGAGVVWFVPRLPTPLLHFLLSKHVGTDIRYDADHVLPSGQLCSVPEIRPQASRVPHHLKAQSKSQHVELPQHRDQLGVVQIPARVKLATHHGSL